MMKTMTRRMKIVSMMLAHKKVMIKNLVLIKATKKMIQIRKMEMTMMKATQVKTLNKMGQ